MQNWDVAYDDMMRLKEVVDASVSDFSVHNEGMHFFNTVDYCIGGMHLTVH